MATSIRTKIGDKLVSELEKINRANGFNTDVLEVARRLRFIDEIDNFPSIFLVAGSEDREYLPDFSEKRTIVYLIRAYVQDDDSDAALNNLIEDIEITIRNAMKLDNLSNLVTNIIITGITTDEGLLTPEGVAEFTVAATVIQ